MKKAAPKRMMRKGGGGGGGAASESDDEEEAMPKQAFGAAFNKPAAKSKKAPAKKGGFFSMFSGSKGSSKAEKELNVE